LAQQKTALAFRKQINGRISLDPERQVLNRYTETWADGTQTIVELVERSTDGLRGVIEYHGEIRNFPKAARAKRTAGNALDVDDYDEEERDREEAVALNPVEAAARKKKAKHANLRKKQKSQVSPTRRSTRVAEAVRRTGVHPTIPEEAGQDNPVKDEMDEMGDLLNNFDIASVADSGTCLLFSREDWYSSFPA